MRLLSDCVVWVALNRLFERGLLKLLCLLVLLGFPVGFGLERCRVVTDGGSVLRRLSILDEPLEKRLPPLFLELSLGRLLVRHRDFSDRLLGLVSRLSMLLFTVVAGKGLGKELFLESLP